MPSTTEKRTATRGQLVTAMVLLAGVLLLAYGYAHPSKIGFYVGLLVTVAGVAMGVIGVLTNGRR